ncbi:MAG: tRNA (N(6)-L-threonylcarbamoyladenosine(37)-C(2))-methylthiotransferase [Methanomassiliicoccales archaeon]|nr:tRNA (N(6)-L-threonylcarbamoyladenosine(37)-C(2))-methylthiotransferase [Methanomassiliicoccales archaeon]
MQSAAVRFHFETYGCTMNHGESQEMMLIVKRMGHTVVSDLESSEVAVVNTCVVIAPTERKILRHLNELQNNGKRLVIIGCMASVAKQKLARDFPGALICGTTDYPGLPSLLKEEFGIVGESTDIEGATGPLVLPIAQGCNGCCTYCITKLARGDLDSYPLRGLVDKARAVISQGVKEILITSQDTAAYGMDGSDRLPDLLRAVCALPGDFRVRVGMMNPDNLKEIVDDLVGAYKHPKVYRFLHLPVQSGSGSIIREMGRAYSVQDYLGMVAKMRKAVPELTLSTDVITGFPGETEEDHTATVALMEALRPNIINITRFSSRPGTVAEGMKMQVPGWVSKKRSRELTALRFSISSQINASKIGREYTVLINERGKGNSVMARTNDYLPVVIKGEHELWQWARVKITAAATTHLYGAIVQDMEN